MSCLVPSCARAKFNFSRSRSGRSRSLGERLFLVLVVARSRSFLSLPKSRNGTVLVQGHAVLRRPGCDKIDGGLVAVDDCFVVLTGFVVVFATGLALGFADGIADGFALVLGSL